MPDRSGRGGGRSGAAASAVTTTTAGMMKSVPSVRDLSRTDEGLGRTGPAPYESETEGSADDLPLNMLWAPDKGRGGYTPGQRERTLRPTLIESGRKAGRSRVQYDDAWRLFLHSWVRDFFISALNTSLKKLLAGIVVLYTIVFLIFAGIWMAYWAAAPQCLASNDTRSFGAAMIFSIATSQTIGYGNTAPLGCPASIIILTIQTLTAIVMEAVTLGVIFARISHPKQRARTIAISEPAVIARRDGILKFMVRVADFRPTQVINPMVKAFLFTWAGRTTAEGEHIPVRVEELTMGSPGSEGVDGMLILPLIIEHTIDEKSPLCGHTHDTLTEAMAEIVVTFEGTSEMGNPFMARRSYVPSDIRWGHQFRRMIHAPAPGSGKTRVVVDLDRLHDVEPQDGLRMLPPSALSRAVVGRSLRCVPYPLLGENTLVLSDSLVLGTDRAGRPALLVRIGDTYPNQHLEIMVKAYLYRWRHPRADASVDGGGGGGGGGRGSPLAGSTAAPAPAPEPQNQLACSEPDDYEVTQLDVGYGDGSDRLSLWLPVVARHVIRPGSPLAGWLQPGGLLADADACVAVTVEGYRYSSAANAMRTRVYSVLRDVRPGCAFLPIVTAPGDSPDHKPRVNWARFHDTVPLPGGRGWVGDTFGGGGGRGGGGGGGGGAGSGRGAGAGGGGAATAPTVPQGGPPRLRRDSMKALRADAAVLPSRARGVEWADGGGRGGGGGGGAGPSGAAPVPPTLSASSPPRLVSRRSAHLGAPSAPAPEAASSMTLLPDVDPNHSFRLRSAHARARLDASAFQAGASGGGGGGGGTGGGGGGGGGGGAENV